MLADDPFSRMSRKGWIFNCRGGCQFTFLKKLLLASTVHERTTMATLISYRHNVATKHGTSKLLTTNELWLQELQIKRPVYWLPYLMHYGICANCLLYSQDGDQGERLTACICKKNIHQWPINLITLCFLYAHHTNSTLHFQTPPHLYHLLQNPPQQAGTQTEPPAEDMDTSSDAESASAANGQQNDHPGAPGGAAATTTTTSPGSTRTSSTSSGSNGGRGQRRNGNGPT